MNRRDLIKSLVLSSGMFLFPVTLFPEPKKKPLCIVEINSFWYPSFTRFREETPHAVHIRISGEQKNYLKIPELFQPGVKYIIVTDLIKSNALLSGSMIHWLQSRQIEFRFFVTLPLFNSLTGDRVKSLLQDFNDDAKVCVFDVNAYLGKLSKTDPVIMAEKAFEALDTEVYFYLKGLI